MPREKEDFRINLERLDIAFPKKEILLMKDVCSFTGLSYPTVKKKFDLDSSGISKVKLARMLS